MQLNIFCMRIPIKIHANGKLLITGEYLVLVGAKALALPVRFGQTLFTEEIDQRIIDWESSAMHETWFKAKFDSDTLNVKSTDNQEVAYGLKNILTFARKLNPDFLTGNTGYKVNIHADYPLSWGLGSSSTLCYLVAKWAGVDAFELHRLVSTGSGYDIACAGQTELLYYQLENNHPAVTTTHPGKALRENTYFVYLGKKQDSRREVLSFSTNKNYTDQDVDQVSRLASFICQADSAGELISLVNEHEAIMAAILKREPLIKQFPDFPGTVKSMGAWGGDFAMFVSELDRLTISNILNQKGFSTIFSYPEIEAVR
jgi:mevalonate kinase